MAVTRTIGKAMGSADRRIDVQALDEEAPRRPVPAKATARMRAVVEDNVDFICRSLRRLGVASADVGDGAQRVFLIASRKLSLVPSATERAFLFQIAMRVAANDRRTQRRRRESGEAPLFELATNEPSPEDVADDVRRRRLLDRVLDTMALETRAVFVLSEIEGLTMAEIAAMTLTPPGTVASRLRRAREQFRAGVESLRREGRI
jgi:RNA polymerase sigma-70 factor (ECF subfamily)